MYWIGVCFLIFLICNIKFFCFFCVFKFIVLRWILDDIIVLVVLFNIMLLENICFCGDWRNVFKVFIKVFFDVLL